MNALAIFGLLLTLPMHEPILFSHGNDTRGDKVEAIHVSYIVDPRDKHPESKAIALAVKKLNDEAEPWRRGYYFDHSEPWVLSVRRPEWNENVLWIEWEIFRTGVIEP